MLLRALIKSAGIADAFLGQGFYQEVFGVMEEAIAYNNNQPELLIRAIKSASTVGDNIKAREWLEHLISLTLSFQQLNMMVSLSLATGAIDLALIAAEQQLVFESENPELRAQLADLYLWNGLPDKALNQKLWLVNYDQGNEDAFTQSWQLARRLFKYQVVLELLLSKSEKRPLDRVEIETLVETLVDLGQPEKAEGIINQYLVKNPDDLLLWLGLAQLQQDQEKLLALSATWRKIHERFTLSNAEFLNYIEVLQTIGHLEEALDLLYSTSFKNSDKSSHSADQTSLWHLLAELAWRTENDEVAAKAIEQLLNLMPENQENIDRYLTLTSAFPSLQRLEIALSGFELYKTAYYALTAMELAAQLEKWHVLDRLIVESEPYPHITEHYSYWLAKARLSIHINGIESANYAFDRALNDAGNAPDIIQSYLWFLISTQQNTLLHSKVLLWHELAKKDESLWPVIASAWNSLGNQPLAMAWYAKALKNQPDDALLWLVYADTLMAAGWVSEAWSIRRNTLFNLKNKKIWLPDIDWQPRHIQARVWFLGLANSIQWVYSNFTPKPDSWLTELSALLIDAGNLPAANEWISQHQQQNKTTPLFQLLAVALQGDREQLELLLNQLEPGPERVEALKMAGYRSVALSEALTELNDNYTEVLQHQLTEQAIALSQEYPTGWCINGLTKNDGSLASYGQNLTFAHRSNRWYVKFDSEVLHFRHSGNVIAEKVDDQLSNNIQVSGLTDNGFWSCYTDVSQRYDSQRWGAGIQNVTYWDSRLITKLYAEYHGKSEITSLMNVFGQQNQLEAEANYQIAGSDHLLLTGAYKQFSDRYSTQNIGSGYQFKASWQHMLLYRDPEWLLSAGIDWQQYTLESRLGNTLSEQLISGNTVSSLLPEQYRFYYLSSYWQHGQPGALNARVPSPRWLLGFSLGYQQPESIISYRIESGFGWRILGNDELSLIAGYNSSPLGSEGRSGYQLNFGYQYRLGK